MNPAGRKRSAGFHGLNEHALSTVRVRARTATLPEAPAMVKRKTTENARESTIRSLLRFARFRLARIIVPRPGRKRRRTLTPDSACKYGRFEELTLDPVRRMSMVGATVG
jgi:hypothetical protein